MNLDIRHVMLAFKFQLCVFLYYSWLLRSHSPPNMLASISRSALRRKAEKVHLNHLPPTSELGNCIARPAQMLSHAPLMDVIACRRRSLFTVAPFSIVQTIIGTFLLHQLAIGNSAQTSNWVADNSQTPVVAVSVLHVLKGTSLAYMLLLAGSVTYAVIQAILLANVPLARTNLIIVALMHPTILLLV